MSGEDCTRRDFPKATGVGGVLRSGAGLDANGDSGYLNDLWKRQSAGEWTWVSGSAVKNQSGFYGDKGVSNPANVPGSRWQSIGCLT